MGVDGSRGDLPGILAARARPVLASPTDEHSSPPGARLPPHRGAAGAHPRRLRGPPPRRGHRARHSASRRRGPSTGSSSPPTRTSWPPAPSRRSSRRGRWCCSCSRPTTPGAPTCCGRSPALEERLGDDPRRAPRLGPRHLPAGSQPGFAARRRLGRGLPEVRHRDRHPPAAGARGRPVPGGGGRLRRNEAGAGGDARRHRAGGRRSPAPGVEDHPQGGRALRRVLDRARVGQRPRPLLPALRPLRRGHRALPLPLAGGRSSPSSLALGHGGGPRGRGGIAARLLLHGGVVARSTHRDGDDAGHARVPPVPLRGPARGRGGGRPPGLRPRQQVPPGDGLHGGGGARLRRAGGVARSARSARWAIWTAVGLALGWIVAFTLFPALQKVLRTPTGRTVAAPHPPLRPAGGR